MELTACLLADAAQQTPDGKVHILGGHWERIYTTSFPTTHPSLAVVLIFRVEYTEALDRHELRVELFKDGQAQGPSAMGYLQLGHPATIALGASQSVAAALTFPLVTFQSPGRYEWIIRIDGEVQGSLPLELMEASQLPGFPPFPGVAPKPA